MFNVDFHQGVFWVVYDFINDVRTIWIVLLSFIFLDAQVIIELGSVWQGADLSDTFMRFLQDFTYLFTEFVTVGFEHDCTLIFVKYSFNFEYWLLDLFADRSLLFVVLSFEFLRCEHEMFSHFVHDVECQLQVGTGQHNVFEFDESDQFLEVGRLCCQLCEFHLTVRPVTNQCTFVIISAFVNLAIFDADTIFGAVVGLTIIACSFAELLYFFVSFIEFALALFNLALVFFHEVFNHLVHFIEWNKVEFSYILVSS